MGWDRSDGSAVANHPDFSGNLGEQEHLLPLASDRSRAREPDASPGGPGIEVRDYVLPNPQTCLYIEVDVSDNVGTRNLCLRNGTERQAEGQGESIQVGWTMHS